ncbi:MAG: hypothetical protein V7K48_15300 [Nostoc sp.]|uniref:hypothetical protein n=1 Tax=Nostoc sp. TaxID=1180 RepID=UPI002FFA1491
MDDAKNDIAIATFVKTLPAGERIRWHRVNYPNCVTVYESDFPTMPNTLNPIEVWRIGR